MRGLPYGRGFGHVFGLLFLARHPVLLLIFAAAIAVMYVINHRR